MGSEGGWSRGRALAMSMTKAVPKAQLRCVVVDALTAARRRGGGGRRANIGVRSTIGCSQGPSATVLMIETCIATRKGAEIGIGQRRRRRAGHWLFPTAQLQCVVIDALVVTALSEAEVGSVSEGGGVSGWGDGMVDMKEGRDGDCRWKAV